jgi:hypothetical protein
MSDQLYHQSKALFGWLSGFDHDWREGWRPAIDPWTDTEGITGHDILFLSPLGCYARLCGYEQAKRGSQVVFDTLLSTLIEKRMYADHEPGGYHRHVNYVPEQRWIRHNPLIR